VQSTKTESFPHKVQFHFAIYFIQALKYFLPIKSVRAAAFSMQKRLKEFYKDGLTSSIQFNNLNNLCSRHEKEEEIKSAHAALKG